MVMVPIMGCPLLHNYDIIVTKISSIFRTPLLQWRKKELNPSVAILAMGHLMERSSRMKRKRSIHSDVCAGSALLLASITWSFICCHCIYVAGLVGLAIGVGRLYASGGAADWIWVRHQRVAMFSVFCTSYRYTR